MARRCILMRHPSSAHYMNPISSWSFIYRGNWRTTSLPVQRSTARWVTACMLTTASPVERRKAWIGDCGTTRICPTPLAGGKFRMNWVSRRGLNNVFSLNRVKSRPGCRPAAVIDPKSQPSGRTKRRCAQSCAAFMTVKTDFVSSFQRTDLENHLRECDSLQFHLLDRGLELCYYVAAREIGLG